MHRTVEMTVLIDNLAAEPLASEWGLSILISLDSGKILLDTGASRLFARNAECLGIDLSEVDLGVLSHAHSDHAGGLDAFFALNRKAPFLVRGRDCGDCYGTEDGETKYIGIPHEFLREYEPRIQHVDGVRTIADGVWLVPHRKADYSSIALRNELYALRGGRLCPDDFAHEQSLVIDTEKGLIVFNSCSHTGLTNILADIRELLGRRDVCAYVGGLHLYRMTDEELTALCEEIGNTAIEHIFTGHCTGDHAFGILKAALGGRIEQFSSGFSYSFV